MNGLVSPKYQMDLIKSIHDKIWEYYKSYREVRFYIEKWQLLEEGPFGPPFPVNFHLIWKEEGDIDLLPTLNSIDSETLIKIAIDLGVETPGFIPSIPTFRNELKSDYRTAAATFEKAFKDLEAHPDVAIGLANSALESITKEILRDKRIQNNLKGTETLYDLTQEILKSFEMFPSSEMPKEIKTIGSSFLKINQNIEDLRSKKTAFHGKTDEEYVIVDPLYAYFIVNSVATIGLFLISFYKHKFPIPVPEDTSDDELPI